MARETFKYFRIEARELVGGLNEGALRLEKGLADKELVAQLLRLAHTLKGAARVVRLIKIAECAHALEDLLAPHRDGGGPISRTEADALLALLDTISAEVAAIETPISPGAKAPPARVAAPKEEAFETVRVEREEVDRLLFAVTEAAVQVNALRQQGGQLERIGRLAAAVIEGLGVAGAHGDGGAPKRGRMVLPADALRTAIARLERELASGLERLAGELDQVRDAANRLRLVAASSIFGSLERAARDAAHSLGRPIDFRTSGGDTRLDAHVLGSIGTALIHVVRNAVAHGIESDADRAAARKPVLGRLELRVARRGSLITFICSDDGRGIDLDSIRRVARERGLLSDAEAAALTPVAACQLLLRAGMTTMGTVTDIAGRGVGLDVVRETAARLKGEVLFESEPGKGSTITFSVPVSISSINALLVEAGGGTVAALPLEAVQCTAYHTPAEILRAGAREGIVIDGEAIPFVALTRILREPDGAQPAHRTWSTIVVRAGDRRAAFGVERLLGTAVLVMLSLPEHTAADAVIAGASLNAEGVPQLVLDPDGLVTAAHLFERRDAPLEEAKIRVLVIDDSLTTRMLEQAILESAGYDVDLASSAEEGLARARERRYGIFVVDVEMPGMDGFDFVATTRADPDLRATPAILVTSRASTEDLRRGREVGARGYIVKGDFDQGTLLETMRSLVRPA